ncbi:Acid protease [Mycena venus]|uniref:Acid protease n=1 Tax=Mycena venus TaxID=2733690 RepID=A0A8H6X263_9AGAR|nr:Acid protease [Mycena venus]
MRLLWTISIVPYLFWPANADFTFMQHRALSQHEAPPPAEFTVPFTAKVPRRKSKLATGRWEMRSFREATVSLDGANFETEYLTNITVGGQNFSVIVDTGSSDTWIIQKGFMCSDANGNPVSESTCAFGSQGFDREESKTFQGPFPNALCNLTYGSGFFLNGPIGFDNIAIGGLSVSHQEICLPTQARYEGDGIFSGILGLAFPAGINVFNTTVPANASDGNRLPFDPFFFSAVKEKKVKRPFFSVALNRGTFGQESNDQFDPNLGFLSFGGIAPVPVVNTSVTVPIQGYQGDSIFNSTPSDSPDAEFVFYTINVDSYTFPRSSGLLTASNNTILDTGTPVNIVPTDVAAAYTAAFNPPATLIPTTNGLQIYVVDCNATAPDFLVTIGNTTFSIDPQDQGPGTLAVDPDSVLVLGAVFLRNVVATFNPMAREVTLTQRTKY